jgi:hypothetical protein
MPITLKDRMTSDLVRLQLDMSVGEARAALAGDPGRLGVVFDHNDPVTLLSATDLEEEAVPEQSLRDVPGGLPPGVMAPSGMPVADFVDSGAFAALSMGARGALVIEGDQVVGALTEGAIDHYLPYREKALTTRGADVGLAGSIATGKVILYCDEFRHRNELTYYNRHRPPMCQVETPHVHPIRRQA